jgi:hypothetical protein
MNSSVIFYQDLSGIVRVVDPDALACSEELSPLMELAAAVILTGLKGVRVDEQRRPNGTYLQAVDLDTATPEGQVFERLFQLHAVGRSLPSASVVLEMIATAYLQVEA